MRLKMYWLCYSQNRSSSIGRGRHGNRRY
jgi:hypothetical protein